MNTFINYLIEVNVGLCVFLLVYVMLLSSETNFNFNRAYLLLSVLISLISPIFHFGDQNSALPTLSITLPEVAIQDGISGLSTTHGLEEWLRPMLWVYAAGAFLYALRLLFQLVSLRYRLRHAILHSRAARCTILETTDLIPSFSFFNYIVLGNSGQLSAAEKEKIIEHESVHIDQSHSIDLLLIELLGVVFWFNPAIWIYRKILKRIHEYQADQKIIEHHDADQYITLLTRMALISADFPLTSHFNNSLTLKRIIMMKTLKRKMKRWKMVAVLPVFFGFVFVASCQDQVKSTTPKSFDDEIFTVVEELPSYVKGMDAMISYLKDEIRYPENAKKNGIQGKVFVSFVITKKGDLVDPAIVKSANAELDAEALRVVSGLSKWNPGHQNGRAVNVRFVLPVNFAL